VIADGQGETEAKTLDTLFPYLRDLTVLKLDIEGYEVQAIQGAANLLQHNRPLIVAELQNRDRFEMFRRLVAPWATARTGTTTPRPRPTSGNAPDDL